MKRLIQKHFLGVCLALALGGLPALAGDGVRSTGKLSDNDFFRLATCGAAPGMTCKKPIVRWHKRDVTVGITETAATYPKQLSKKVSRALDTAIAEINSVGASLRLVRNDELAAPDIIVTLPDLSEGERTRDIPRMPDGEEIGVGFMWLWWDDRSHITEASFLIARDITDEDLSSVVLEELFQSLGFLHDIENLYYESRSILAQDSNTTTTITGQDRKLLRKLYP